MKPFSLSFVPFLLAFILGVHFSTQIDPLFKWVDGGIGLILLLYFSFNSLLQWRVLLFGFAFFILGIQAGEIDQRISNTHYSQFVKPAQQNYFKVVLKRKLSPSKTRERYYVTVKKVNDQPASGSLLLTVNKSEGDKSSLDYQNIWIIKGQISPIKGPSNPGGFNYKAYLKSIKINYQTNIDKKDISRAESTGFSLLKYNAFLLKKLDESKLNPQTIAILKTILLGERSSLNTSTRDEFAKAGVVHLFAISGLHVGLLMLFFQTLFRPLVSLPRGKLWQNIAVLACLWCYAFLVGGSASVIRAVTLFSAY